MNALIAWGSDDVLARRLQQQWSARFRARYDDGLLIVADAATDEGLSTLRTATIQQGLFTQPTLCIVDHAEKLPDTWVRMQFPDDFFLCGRSVALTEKQQAVFREAGWRLQHAEVPSPGALSQWWGAQYPDLTDQRAALAGIAKAYGILERAVTRKRKPLTDVRSWFLHMMAERVRMGATSAEITEIASLLYQEEPDIFGTARQFIRSSPERQVALAQGVPESEWYGFLGSLTWIIEQERVGEQLKKLLALWEIGAKNSLVSHRHQCLFPVISEEDGAVYHAAWLSSLH
jgi:hypothetical protein